MRLTDLTAEIHRSEAVLAPGSESSLWGDYCEAIREATGVLPYADHDPEIAVPDDLARLWMGAYRRAEFGLSVRSYRKEEGLTQAQLGERIGRTQLTIHRWESGEREPKWSEAIALAKALGVEPQDLG